MSSRSPCDYNHLAQLHPFGAQPPLVFDLRSHEHR